MEKKNETDAAEHDEEDEKEGINTEEQQEDDEQENIETAEDLIKEKVNSKFIAHENTAQVQIFVQNANFENKTDIKRVLDLANVSTSDDKKYNLQKTEDCTAFFSTCKKQDYIVLAIVLSVFEFVPIGDYTNLKDLLTECLPAVLQIGQDGKETYNQQTDSYLPLNTMLSVIGAKTFIMDSGQQCIGYGDGFENVLSNIWEQFPDLRNPMISWLLKINGTFRYKTSFEAYQIMKAFFHIITKDFRYAERQVFGKLYTTSNNLGLIARLAQELLKDKRFNSDILNIVLNWAESQSNWLWKAAFLVCLHTYETSIDRQLHKTIISAIKKRMFRLYNSDLRFIVLFAGNAKNVRTIMTFVFYDLYRSGNIQSKERLAQIYLKMIRYGYYQVDKNKVNLPFVVCDSKEQMENVQVVLSFIMDRYDLYRQLCWILQAYIQEISGYDVPSESLNHLTAFFYVLTRGQCDYQKDILLFLSELEGNVAKKIYNKLIKIYSNNGGERK